MRLLFDQNISYRVVKQLQANWPEFTHISNCKLTDAPDNVIWQYAKQSNYCIVTHDDDFDDLFSLYGFPPKVVKLKTGNLSNSQTILILNKHTETIKQFLNNSEEGFLTIYAV
jgi:predicted nuclease of predicted toxin-antitoxin system